MYECEARFFLSHFQFVQRHYSATRCVFCKFTSKNDDLSSTYTLLCTSYRVSGFIVQHTAVGSRVHSVLHTTFAEQLPTCKNQQTQVLFDVCASFVSDCAAITAGDLEFGCLVGNCWRWSSFGSRRAINLGFLVKRGGGWTTFRWVLTVWACSDWLSISKLFNIQL